ncbi:Iwr1 domain-containing protein [Aspergillus homomorphus CBS 101889]|uniref:Transcription factor Iwr1 domain-containing protein n=1 Tax=Aspergillus homomorphus (strain CBS 101889) TaxID=1450537 RepID=A0A395HW50_ASPHC|nr:hypothetical protein BO97DRAFT_405506 [Aspergillus homomorphus CBS 101889]RAL12142.1 hypothetical protein BO97DRAFT_405506 [Aspergillus homomorphus CBS 101889]
MALPPEQINIKRRREEEPVDTLYIQSELHQTKRRFTDFVFQRVQISSHGPKGTTASGTADPSSSLVPGQQRVIRTPRSVSSGVSSRTSAANDGGGTPAAAGVVPMVRATSPGAEFREERRLAAARREQDEKMKRALYSSPVPSTPASPAGARSSAPAPAPSPAHAAERTSDSAAVGKLISTASSGNESPASPSTASQSLRRFQISRSSTPVNSTLRSTGAGVQKRKGDSPVAVLVEKLRRKPHSRQASLVADAVAGVEGLGAEVEEPIRPRKRPVVNQAERKWREERKTAISAAKQHISQVLDKEAQASHQRTWEAESERLAKELEQVALELDAEMEVDMSYTGSQNHPRNITSLVSGAGQPPQSHSVGTPKPTLKYQPRTPNKHSSTQKLVDGSSVQNPNSAADALTADQDDDEVESDGEYVYDTYIRRPLPVSGLLADPLANLELDHEAWFKQHGIDMTRQDIGVIVITLEDEEYWENFVEEEEEDEERWDSEDADSNAENNPANDYPDEELSWDDEDEDPTAIYSKYRNHARSDDEEFDFDDSASEGHCRFDYGFRSHVESDEESW